MKAPMKIQGVYKRTQKQRNKKKKKKKKKTYKDPTTIKNPKHPNKNPNTLYNITS
jgi:hypothetical protein